MPTNPNPTKGGSSMSETETPDLPDPDQEPDTDEPAGEDTDESSNPDVIPK